MWTKFIHSSRPRPFRHNCISRTDSQRVRRHPFMYVGALPRSAALPSIEIHAFERLAISHST